MTWYLTLPPYIANVKYLKGIKVKKPGKLIFFEIISFFVLECRFTTKKKINEDSLIEVRMSFKT